MIRNNPRVRRAVGLVVLAIGFGVLAEACEFEITFGAYLQKRLWQPTWKYVSEMANGLRTEKSSYAPYAGMSTGRAGTGISHARAAYRALFSDPTLTGLNWPDAEIANLRNIVRTASAANADEAHELSLLQCKVELRAWFAKDDAGLRQVQTCFETYLAQPRPAAFASEARGWLARTEYLAGRGARASNIYLSELASETSNIRRERLLGSLQIVYPRQQDLDGYFDSPAHALFAANQITSRDSLQDLAPSLILGLEQHANLFGQGAQSDALAIALMRTAIKSGAPAAALRYAERIPPNADTRRKAEYNWLVGTARFAEKDYSGAESALKNVMTSNDADVRQKAYAASGLIGVYSRLNQPVDALWAAFQVASLSETVARNGDVQRQVVPIYPAYYYEVSLAGVYGVLNFDAPYLMDAQLTDSELEESVQYSSMKPSDVPAMRYALAVRYARRERYSDAARIYDALGSPRASLMRTAAKLFAPTNATGARPQSRFEAMYAYAEFLSNHENEVFFNDRLWDGYQTVGFSMAASWTDDAARTAEMERRLRDEQEEYWRAYLILNQVVEEAGPTPIGKKAAERAIICLRKINSRFGRSEDISNAELMLRRWLAQK